MHFAGSGEEALDKLVTGIEPQLIVILSDTNIPGMDGLTLLGGRSNGRARTCQSRRSGNLGA